MDSIARQRRILEILQARESLSVEDAQDALGASPSTVRRDFSELADRLLVTRGRGTIHRLETSAVMGVLPYSKREVANPDAKTRIARAAASLIGEGDVVIIDGGTTTVGMAAFLPSSCRVITNSLPLATALHRLPGDRNPVPEVNMTGGYLYPRGEVLLGPEAILILREFRAAWAFISASGITDDGVLNSNNLVVDTQRAMIDCADRVALLVDSSKMARAGMVKICSLDTLDVVVTDARPPRALAEPLAAAGVEVLVGE